MSQSMERGVTGERREGFNGSCNSGYGGGMIGEERKGSGWTSNSGHRGEECSAGIEGEMVAVLALNGKPPLADKRASLMVAEVEGVEYERQAFIEEVEDTVAIRITTNSSNLEQHGIGSILGTVTTREEQLVRDRAEAMWLINHGERGDWRGEGGLQQVTGGARGRGHGEALKGGRGCTGEGSEGSGGGDKSVQRPERRERMEVLIKKKNGGGRSTKAGAREMEKKTIYRAIAHPLHEIRMT